MGINERLSIAVGARSLSWSDHQTRPVELAAAMAGASALSSDIFRAKQNDRAALRRASLMLAHQAQRVGKQRRLFLSPSQSLTFASAALVELLFSKCKSCCGASVIIANDRKIECPNCNGTGVHRHSNAERALNCGVREEDWAKWQRRFEMVLGIAIAADNAAAAARTRLG